jgi:hypothetical protein
VFYARDEYRVDAFIYALTNEPTRIWTPAGPPIQDPAWTVWPLERKGILVKSLQVWLLDIARLVKMGVLIELVNLTEPGQGPNWIPVNQLTLPTRPMDGLQSSLGVFYDGPGFECPWGCGWTIRAPALVLGDYVEMRVGWE